MALCHPSKVKTRVRIPLPAQMKENLESNASVESETLIRSNLWLMDSDMVMIANYHKLSKITVFIDTARGKILAFNKTTEWPFHPTELIPETPDPARTKSIIFSLIFDEKVGTYVEIVKPNISDEFSENAKKNYI